jgi:hypothetical protein
MLTLGRKWSFVLTLVTVAVTAIGQESYQWRTASDVREGGRGRIVGTVTDVNEARNQFSLVPDDDSAGGVLISADAVSTQFNGFGGVINGKPEIFTGTQGFSNLRAGDRVEVRGLASTNAAVQADVITLRGRSIAAAPTGVGSTRPPGSISTPTQTTVTADRLNRVEGIVRQVNQDNNSLVIETDQRQMITVRAAASTPVYYKNDVYHVSNLEVGDRVRVEPDTAASTAGDVRARVIDVVRSIQDTGGAPASTVAGLTGRVTRVDRPNDIVTIDTGRGQTRIDLANATDATGRRIHASDLQIGDRVDVSGTQNNDFFVATTVRFSDNVFAPGTPGAPGTAAQPQGEPQQLGAVTIYGTIAQTLADAPQLVVKDAQNHPFTVYALDDFLVRGKTSGYTTADKLKEGDSVVVKAFRDADGNYIAQTIRLR